MDPDAMRPYAAALRAYFEGNTGARLIVRRDDGLEVPLPAAWFFRGPAEFTAIERAAIELCRGRVLDAGAGTGLHSLVLQQKGLRVTAIDISPRAVEIMARRGVQDPLCADVFEYRGCVFDTLLMMGHGIGVVETMTGLDRFLCHARALLARDGQILLDSLDVRVTRDSRHLAYHEANRHAGRYIGETRVQVEFEGDKGPWWGWLHVDPETLRERAARSGWKCDPILQAESGDYLARLVY